MKIRILSLALALCGALAFGTAAAADRSADEAALREIKEVLWPKAYFEQDTELLGRLLAPEFQMVDGDGNWTTRADELDWVRKNKPGYDSLTGGSRRSIIRFSCSPRRARRSRARRRRA